MVRAETVGNVEHLAGAPLAANQLPFHGAEGIGGEGHVVVLVGLGDRAGLVNLEKVQRDAEMSGRQIGEAVGGRLVADGERVAQFFDRQLLFLFRASEKADGAILRHHQRGRQVVRFDPLSQKTPVVFRLLRTKHVARERLQEGGSGVTAGIHHQVDAAVGEVADRPRWPGQVANIVQRETQMRGQIGCDALRQRAASVPDRREQAAGLGLKLRKVIALFAHLLAKFGVDPPGLFRRRRPLAVQSLELGVKAEDRLDRLVAQGLSHRQRGQAERAEQRTALGPLECDLQAGPLRWRLRAKQLVESNSQGFRHRLQVAQARLAFAVLEHAHLRCGATDRGAEVVEGHPAGDP